MMNRVLVFAVVVLLTSFSVSEGMSLRIPRSPGVEIHCRCINKESKDIRSLIKKVEVIFPTSHCEEIEIIATLKRKGTKVCLDPKAPWLPIPIIEIIGNSTKVQTDGEK